MSRKSIWGISASALFVALAVVFGISQWQTARALEVTLNAAREKAYYSALDGLTNLQTDLGKVLIAESPGQRALLLGHVAALAVGVSENLSALPPSYGADTDGMKFLAQTADYALALATAAAEGRRLSDEDERQINQLREKCAELRRHLENGAGFLYDDMPDAERVAGIDYPVLLYDGPFSDGIRVGKPRGLAGEAITPEQALAIGTAFLSAEQVGQAQRAPDTGGPMPAYGVQLALSDLSVTMAVTKEGGKVLWMAPETAGFIPYLDIDECILHARAFLTSRGFGEMRESYYQMYDGIAVINFAAVQDGVILYPDLVKIQVRMDTGGVIGLEAGGYWMNHVVRERLHPRLPEQEARERVSDRLSISQVRLCVIPREDGLRGERIEALCYEFDGTYQGDRFLVYIDAETGDELNVLKVVLGGEGILAI